MAPLTRRRALRGAAALLAVGAGCNGSSTDLPRSTEPERPENVESDPESYVLRNPADDAVAWLEPEDEREIDPRGGTSEREYNRGPQTGLVASPEAAERLRFADVDGVDGARRFVDATDFERETLLVDAGRVSECYRRVLCYVTWSATEYHTYYAMVYRDADVACSTDDQDTVARLVRIPDALDPEKVTRSGSATRSGACMLPPHRRRRREVSEDDEPGTGNATDGNGTGTATTEGRR